MPPVNDNGCMSTPVSRRSLGQIFAAAVVARQTGTAQTAAPSDADLASAREQMRANAAQIDKVKLPMATEPACHFKA